LDREKEELNVNNETKEEVKKYYHIRSYRDKDGRIYE